MRPRFPVAVHVFLLRGDEILLLRRLNTGYEDGKLSVVAGHVEPGETVTQAAMRESREEVGLELSPDRMRVVGVMHRKSGDERIDFFLSYLIEREEARNAEAGKCSELVWAKLSRPPDDTIAYVRAAIENFRNGRWFQEFGWEHDARPSDGRSMQERVAQLLPKREGHFVFESGHHGQVWLDLELLLLHPERVQPLAATLADRLRGHQVTAVCGPLVEGAFVGLMVASALHLPFSYSEPVRDHRAAGLFPVSYLIPRALQAELRGKRVAIVNDVINAGSAVGGTLAALKQCGAQPVAIGTLAVYGHAARELAATHGVALETLASFSSRIWEPSACPLCAKGVPTAMPVANPDS